MEMADLVKRLMRKTSAQNEKQCCSTLLGKFANCLDTYQVMGRDWISENVWKLPPVRPVEEQEVLTCGGDIWLASGVESTHFIGDSKLTDEELLRTEEEGDPMDIGSEPDILMLTQNSIPQVQKPESEWIKPSPMSSSLKLTSPSKSVDLGSLQIRSPSKLLGLTSPSNTDLVKVFVSSKLTISKEILQIPISGCYSMLGMGKAAEGVMSSAEACHPKSTESALPATTGAYSSKTSQEASKNGY
ncbi:hypothetical protein DPMN_087042 [Dreissena polymorpha]|uniref:Uncharacterized protein n=1 Tax=Dreissena polymorpha TaxID=45954 RepID=A0A9D4KS28_DREPO|nr:hypothetical protein DPMN_087042 [Dreissena polymorpha]